MVIAILHLNNYYRLIVFSDFNVKSLLPVKYVYIFSIHLVLVEAQITFSFSQF